MRAVPASTGRWCRAGVQTPRGRVDLALPADVPVAELVPMVLELIGEPAHPDGSVRDGGTPRPWRLCGPAGGPLPPEATLGGLGVLDGELLHLGPQASAPAPPVFDDPADALAAAVGDGAGTPVPPVGPAAAALVVTAASALLATVRDASLPVVATAAALAVLGAGAALLHARRAPGELDDGAAHGPDTGHERTTAASVVDRHGVDRRPGVGSGGIEAVARSAAASRAAASCAVPPAAVAGLLVLPGPLGSGQVLATAVGAGLAAVLGLVVLRTVTPALLAVAVTAPVVAAAAVVRLGVAAPVGAVAAGLTAVALAAGPVLARVALRVAGIPAPAVPVDQDEITRADAPVMPAPEMADRADLARGMFAGLSAAAALLAGGGAVVAADGGGWAGPALAAVTVAVLLLRARAFAEAGPARTLVAVAVGTAVGAAALAALDHGPLVRLLAAAGLAIGVLVAARVTRARLSPVGRRTLDVLELLLTAAAIPAALAAMGLFELVHGL